MIKFEDDLYFYYLEGRSSNRSRRNKQNTGEVRVEVGYVIISNEIICLRKPVGYFYREEPDGKNDSGWRFFSGEESQEYADDPRNFLMYNASTIVEIEPEIANYLGLKFPIAFERNGNEFMEIK